MITIGVIGYGYWGPNLVRNFFENDSCKLKIVADLNKESLRLLKKRHPTIEVTTLTTTLLSDPHLDAIVIATPVGTHFQIAYEALMKNKHVLIEKPITTSVEQTEKLIALAKKKKRVLMVDHTFIYTGAVSKIKAIIDSKSIGNLQYFDSIRTNLGLYQKDVNVLWDLASHDIAILSYLTSEKPETVQAIGASHTLAGIENIAYLTLKFDSGLIAHFNCSWNSPVKIRQTLIGGSKKMIVYNDIEPTEKIKIYDSGLVLRKNHDKTKVLIDYRTGDVFVPKVAIGEALINVVTDFLKAIEKGIEPQSNWHIGLNVVKILESADRSLQNHGKEITFK